MSIPLADRRRVVLADDPCDADFSGAGPEYAGIYLHARYFDPKLGIFLSPDPIGVRGGMNEYGYGFGDPINSTDRSGLGPNGFPNIPWWLPKWIWDLFHRGDDRPPCNPFTCKSVPPEDRHPRPGGGVGNPGDGHAVPRNPDPEKEPPPVEQPPPQTPGPEPTPQPAPTPQPSPRRFPTLDRAASAALDDAAAAPGGDIWEYGGVLFYDPLGLDLPYFYSGPFTDRLPDRIKIGWPDPQPLRIPSGTYHTHVLDHPEGRMFSLCDKQTACRNNAPTYVRWATGTKKKWLPVPGECRALLTEPKYRYVCFLGM
jgi:RHS repeat-associated protein